DVAGEDGVLGRNLVDQSRQVLRVNDRGIGRALGQRVETRTGLAVVREGRVQMFGVVALAQARGERAKRFADVADESQLERTAISERLRPNVHLRDAGAFGIELTIR